MADSCKHRRLPIADAIEGLPRPGRRDFLRTAAGAGLAMGLGPMLAACGGDDARDVPEGKERQTLFFNLAHEAYAGKTYVLTGGGDRYVLVPVVEKPEVLRRARETNAFLRGVPDDRITHHVEDVVTPQTTVTLFYLGVDLDANAGTWAMSQVSLHIPQSGAAHAYRTARLARPSGPLPLSAKRRLYRLPPAQNERDLHEERALLDTTDLASTLVGLHPDLMALDAGAAHSIHSTVIGTSIDVYELGLTLQGYTEAKPQVTPNVPNQAGWGTLVPLMNTTPSGIAGPIRNVNGKNRGRIQYQPILHPAIAAQVGPITTGLTTAVKNTTTLGADVTGADPGTDGVPNGTLWMRRDGVTHVDQSPGAAVGDANVTMKTSQVGPQNGIDLEATASTSGGTTQVSGSLTNYYVRFLGLYVQFLDDKVPPNPIPLANIPEYVADTIVPGHAGIKGMDTVDTMFLTMVPPMFTILGIPYLPGFVDPSLNVPASAHTVRFLSAGLSYDSSPPPTNGICTPGIVMTALVNYGVTALLAGAGGAAGLSVLMKNVVVPLLVPIAQELVLLTTDLIDGKGLNTPGFWEGQGLAVMKYLLGAGAGAAVGQMVAAIAGDITVSVLEDEIPVAGLIMLAISVAAGVANLLETSIELAYSPWTYVDDLVFTHDLSVTVLPDPGDSAFPRAADHYTVTALFDDGTPYTQTLALSSPNPPLAPIVFKGVPLGGQVTVSTSFFATNAPATPVTLLGKGTTGRVPNTIANPVPPLPIAEVKFPITSSTTYVHRQKTALDAQGARVWNPNAPPPVINANSPGCGTAGAVCDLRDITIRQGTASVPGRLGYGWRSQNTNPTIVPNCAGGAIGPIEQLATIDANTPQSGYGALPCGIPLGATRVAYDLIGSGAANFWLDCSNPATPIVRGVTVDGTPTYDGPGSNRAWGVFHFLPDALLLHPAGHLVSISAATHKLETHRIPPAPMTDANAMTALVAHVKCGQGTQPGLMTSPVGAAVAPDGTILVVEAGDTTVSPAIPNRIQALDLGGNAVRYFTNQPAPYFLELDATANTDGWIHLDIASEFSGLIYLLSYNANTFVYRLDIYHPAQSGTTPVSTTTSVYAGKIAVDVWRNLYTLNYEPLAPSGPGIVEPTVSLWVPTQSCSGVNCVPA